jgi:hypothetical protein
MKNKWQQLSCQIESSGFTTPCELVIVTNIGGELHLNDSKLLSRTTLKMEATNIYERSVITRIYQSTWRSIPEKLNLH